MSKETETMDAAVDELLNMMADDLREQSLRGIEPYEVYLNRVRFQLYKDFGTFLTRFKAGHQALIDELKNEQSDNG